MLCIEEEFNKYDTYAVEQMKRPIELNQYRMFKDGLFALDILTAAEESKINDTKSLSKNKDYDIEHQKKKTDKTREFLMS